MMNNINKNKIIIITTLFLLLLGVYIFALIFDHMKISPVEIEKLNNDNLIKWEIENIKIDRRFIAIQGWAFIENEPIRKFDLNVILMNVETGNAIKIPTVMLENEEINNLHSYEMDLSQSGFLARVRKNLIDFDSEIYVIYLQYNHNQHQLTVNTDIEISNKIKYGNN